VAHGP